MIDNRLTVISKLLAYDYESITVADTAIGLTAGKLTTERRPIQAFITVETAEIRYRWDGTDPTTSEGHLLQPMDTLIVEGVGNMSLIKFVRTGATSGTLKVSYLR